MVLPMARDLARYRIRVNAIAPGVFRKLVYFFILSLRVYLSHLGL